MARVRGLYGKQLLQRKFKTFDFDGVWRDTMGTPPKNGFWLIYGAEKNGKTWLALKLAEYLSQFNKTLFISAEQGTGYTFQSSYERAKLNPKNRKLKFIDYIEISELEEKLKKRQSERIIFIDNITVYVDELKYGELRRLQQEYPNVLFVFVAHEESNEPYTATAKLCKKLADIIIRVRGLACEVSGRCPGGILAIDEEKAQLYHGTEILNDNQCH